MKTFRTDGIFYSPDNISLTGQTLTKKLTLLADPVVNSVIATKNYVDYAITHLNANNILTGTISILRFPGFIGDIVSTTGSNNLSLSQTGVTAGTYTKVTIDTKGRVTNAGYIIQSDIPNLDWGKITSGKPTTLTGYGITDAIPIDGGTISGELLLHNDPVSSNHLVTKRYVDNNINSLISYSVGDIIRKPTSITPTGFLKCNGAYLQRSSYNDLYTFLNIGIDYTYLSGLDFDSYSAIGAGQPWRQQYEINIKQKKDITNWVYEMPFPVTIAFSQAIVTKNKIYTLGGEISGATSSAVYTTDINLDGSLGSWSLSNALPGGLSRSQAIVTKNRVYLMGGYSGTAYVATVYTAPINSDGTLGTWATGTALPGAFGLSQAIVTKNRVYLMGGYNGTAYVATVYTAPINSDGTLGTWTTGTALPVAAVMAQSVVIQNTVYILGGGNSGTNYFTFCKATINSDGTLGSWSLVTGNVNVMNAGNCFVTNGMIYVFGGNNSNGYSVWSFGSSLNKNGSINTMGRVSDILTSSAYGITLSTSNRLYIIGGYNGTVNTSNVISSVIEGGVNDYSPIYNGTINKFDGSNPTRVINTLNIPSVTLPDYTSYGSVGSGRPWQQQYDLKNTTVNDIGIWSTGTALPAALAGSTTIVTNTMLYIIGGYTTAINVVNTVYTASISNGVIGTITTGIAFPIAIKNAISFVTKNKAYVIGGIDSLGNNLTNVYSAVINIDGTLGTWITETNLPTSIVYASVFITKSSVYLLGGVVNGSISSAVYRGNISSDGTITSWSIDISLPDTISKSEVIVTKNKVYLIGGFNGTSHLSNIYRTEIDSNGYIAGWALSGYTPITLSNHETFVTKNYAYLISGYNGTSYNANIYIAAIDSYGNIGTWALLNSITTGVTEFQFVCTSSYCYIFGGWNGTATVSTFYLTQIQKNVSSFDITYNGTINKFDGTSPIGIKSSYLSLPILFQDYTSYGSGGSGQPWRQQYDINTTQSSDITGWTTGTSLPGSVMGSTCIVTKNRVYLLGGYVNGIISSAGYTAPINTDGTLGTWTTSAAIPSNVAFTQVIVTKNRVYILGGFSTSNAVKNTVYTAPINSDGTLGTWTTDTPLPAPITMAQAITTKNRVYLLGGQTTGFIEQSTVYTAPINSDGTLGTWTTGTSLPVTLSYSQAIVTKNRVYLLGGYINGTVVYTTPINADGTLGTWTTGTSLPVTVTYSQSIVTKNRVYLLGGRFNGVRVATIYSAPINLDGTLGTWTTGGSIPGVLVWSHSIMTKNRVYTLGGDNNSTDISTVYTAPINGSINDYSPFYDGTVNKFDGTSPVSIDVLNVDTQFTIPDYTTVDSNVAGLYTYIKT